MANLDLDKIIDNQGGTVISAATYGDSKDGYVDTAFVTFAARRLDSGLSRHASLEGNDTYGLSLPNTTDRSTEISLLSNSITPTTEGTWKIYTPLNRETIAILPTNPSFVTVADNSYLNLPTQSTSEFSGIDMIIYDATYIYYLKDGAIVKGEKETMKEVDALSGTYDSFCIDGGYIYAWTNSTKTLSKIDSTTMTVTDTEVHTIIDTRTTGNIEERMYVVSGSVYGLFSYTTTGTGHMVVRFDISDLSLTNSTSIWGPSGGGYAIGLSLTTDGTNLFATAQTGSRPYTGSGTLFKLGLDTSVVTSIGIGSGYLTGARYINGYIYVMYMNGANNTGLSIRKYDSSLGVINTSANVTCESGGSTSVGSPSVELVGDSTNLYLLHHYIASGTSTRTNAIKYDQAALGITTIITGTVLDYKPRTYGVLDGSTWYLVAGTGINTIDTTLEIAKGYIGNIGTYVAMDIYNDYLYVHGELGTVKMDSTFDVSSFSAGSYHEKGLNAGKTIVDSSGKVYINVNGTLKIFSTTHQLLNVINNVSTFAVDDDYIYAYYSNDITVYDASTLATVTTITVGATTDIVLDGNNIYTIGDVCNLIDKLSLSITQTNPITGTKGAVDGTELYVIDGTNIYQLDGATMVTLDTIAAAATDIDIYDGYIYVINSTTVTKIEISSFSVIAPLTVAGSGLIRHIDDISYAPTSTGMSVFNNTITDFNEDIFLVNTIPLYNITTTHGGWLLENTNLNVLFYELNTELLERTIKCIDNNGTLCYPSTGFSFTCIFH